ncbi:hypothetical protein STEG23_011745 [Scotinomys teguina]
MREKRDSINKGHQDTIGKSSEMSSQTSDEIMVPLVEENPKRILKLIFIMQNSGLIVLRATDFFELTLYPATILKMFIRLEVPWNVPCIPTLSKAFIMKGCWILSNAFSASNEMIMCCYISNFISDFINLDALSLLFDMDRCVRCPESYYANTEQNHCLQKAVAFLAYEDPTGKALTCLSLGFSALTVGVLGVFVKFHHTPIVKANNQALTYILLITLTFCFLCPLLFIGHPNTATCILQQSTFALLFTLALSAILDKSITVVLAFRITVPGRLIRLIMISRVPNFIIPVCTFFQLVFCGIWLITSPPFIDSDTLSEHGHIIIICNKGSTIAFHSVLGYLCSMALGSYTMAYLSRILPDTFNEAKFITFSMLVFFSVWVTFLPVYHSTKGKLMVAMEVFSILASSITFGQFDTILSDRVQYNSLYQTAPKDTSLSYGIVILMVHFSWTWVGLVLVDDYEGAEILSDLRGEMDSNRVCMVFVVRIPDNFHSSIYYNSKINFLKLVLSSANVVIIYREIESLYPIILIIVTHLSYSRVWVMNSHWDENAGSESFLFDTFHGSLIFAHHHAEISDF